MTSLQPNPAPAGTDTAPAPAASAVTSAAAAGITVAPGSLLEVVLTSLDDDQAMDVVIIPLEGKSSIADAMVIASGRSTRQVATMAQKLAERVKHAGFGHSRIEGLPAADWVLVDTFYNLERMWAFGDKGAA